MRDEDQATIKQMLADYHDPDVDFPPKPEKKAAAPKRKADDDATPAASEKKAKGLPEVPEEVRSGVTMQSLRDVAEELVGRCRDRGVNVPTDAATARQQLGPICRDLLTAEGTLDVRAALLAAEAAWGAKKAVDCECDANGDLAAVFLELSSWEFKKGAKMKGVAYKKVSAALAAHGDAITGGKQAAALPGIGKSSAEKIDEFLATGKIQKLEDYKNDI